MNHARFTELLNLYLDHEISQAETAELEAEIQRSPERRREYQTYYRMQLACAQLFERERAQAPASFALGKALIDAERKVAAPPASRRLVRRPLVAAFAGFAAMAASITLVLVRQAAPVAAVASVDGTQQSGVVAQAETSPAGVTLNTNFNASSAARDDFQTDSLAPRDWHNSAPASAADAPRDLVLAWMQQVELPPVQAVAVEDMTVDTSPIPPRPSTAVFHGSRPQATAQFSAFQFQR